MRILVVDAQGGGMGARLIEELKAQSLADCEIVAVGTNALATGAMRKAGADACATGENAVVYNAQHCDIILGPMGIVLANAMLGEISPVIACAVSGSAAHKILLPVGKCGVTIAGVKAGATVGYIGDAVAAVKEWYKSLK